jgi:two-component system chemotaxis response regulator CheB
VNIVPDPKVPGSALVGRIRVLVVDDSIAQRAMLVALLDADPDLDVVGWAANGAEAVRAAATLRPDVITMDLRMPGMDGLEATRKIMEQTPTPIVLVTSSTSVSEQRTAMEALQAGVLAIVSKPTLDEQNTGTVQELLRMVKGMARVKVVRRWTPVSREAASAAIRTSTPVLPARPLEVIAVGASTGGPQALSELLARLPSAFPLPILVVQHIAVGFVSALMDWLRTQCSLSISLAENGRRLNEPGVHIAPSGHHMIVQNRTIVLTDDPPVSSHRPSATVLFRSVSQEYRSTAVGVILTGMGDDGAVGLRDLRRAGGVTIAQDEASSVVYSMPGTAIQMGVVDHVRSPEGIADLLMQLTRANES